MWNTGFKIKLLALWEVNFCDLKDTPNHELTTWIEAASLSMKYFLMFNITLCPALNKYGEYYEHKANGFGGSGLQLPRKDLLRAR